MLVTINRGASITPAGSGASSTIALVSRGLTAYSSSGTASAAVSSSYATPCSLTGDPSYVAVDISSIVGAIQADGGGYKALAYRWVAGDAIYQPDLHGDSNAALPGSFTIDTNTAAGGSLPGSGWNNEKTVTGYKAQSGSGIIDVAGGKNFFRMAMSQRANGGTGASVFKVDLWGAGNATNAGHTRLNCGWAFVGDSIVDRTINLNAGAGGSSYTSFGDLVFAIKGKVPLQEAMGIDGFKAADIDTNINAWMDNTVAKYIVVEIGTNDWIAGTSGSAFQTTMTSIFNKIIAKGGVPLYTTIPWSSAGGYSTNSGVLDTALTAAASATGATLFVDRRTLYFNGTIALDGDGIHPSNPTGQHTERDQMAAAAATYGNGG